jgi:hypothetical protein
MKDYTNMKDKIENILDYYGLLDKCSMQSDVDRVINKIINVFIENEGE